MKSLNRVMAFVAVMALWAGIPGLAADKTEKHVAFRAVVNGRYVTTAAKGGLNTSSRQIGSNQTFVLIDLNGGELASGDSIQIEWMPENTKPTYWYETEGAVNRIGGKPTAACEFKVKLKEKAAGDGPQPIVLQTVSGRFVSVESAGSGLATVDSEDKASTLEIVDVPKAEATPTTATSSTTSSTTTTTTTTSTVAAASTPTSASTPAGTSTPTGAAPVNNQNPTLYFIGDSTVNNGTRGQKGWGSSLGAYFDTTKINIVNRARGGRSSRTFLTEGLWDKVLADIKPGDFVTMQFGHNDGGRPEGVYPHGRASLKGSGDETREVETTPGQTEVVHTFGWYLRRYITDAKAKGASVIVFSPIPRNRWGENGKVFRSSGDYGKWAAEAATAGGATFIDLNAIVSDQYDQMGKEKVDPLFFGDWTHTSPEGADFNARSVVAGIKAIKDHPLNAHLSDKAKAIKPYVAAVNATE